VDEQLQFDWRVLLNPAKAMRLPIDSTFIDVFSKLIYIKR